MSKYKFSKVIEVDRKTIILDPKTFQGRQDAFSNDTVRKIVNEGYDKSQEPIVCWVDKTRKKNVVISGHSRFEASEQLFKMGDKSLAKMPIKQFLGTKEEAADYAIIESNRSGTKEGLKSDLAAYKRAVAKGYNKKYLQGIFKPDAYLNSLQKLSYLNPSGRFLEYIDRESEKSFPYLRRNAEWVGAIRQAYPKLTDAHETEMFQYLYKSLNGLMVKKEKFVDLINKKAASMYFDASKPLQLTEGSSVDPLLKDGNNAIKEIETEVEQLRRERNRKEESIVKARREGNEAIATKIQDDIRGIDRAILVKIERIRQLKDGLVTVSKTAGFDLFSQAQTPGTMFYFRETKLNNSVNIEIWAKHKPTTAELNRIKKAGFKWSAWGCRWVKQNTTTADRDFCKALTAKVLPTTTVLKPFKKRK